MFYNKLNRYFNMAYVPNYSTGEILIYCKRNIKHRFIETFFKVENGDIRISDEIYQFGDNVFIACVPEGDEDKYVSFIQKRYNNIVESASKRDLNIERMFRMERDLFQDIEELGEKHMKPDKKYLNEMEGLARRIDEYVNEIRFRNNK